MPLLIPPPGVGRATSSKPAARKSGSVPVQEAWEPIRPYAAGSYVNVESGTGSDTFDRAYPGTTGTRVKETWRRYDPDGIFCPVRIRRGGPTKEDGWLVSLRPRG